jgi:hypothetical protein
MDFPSREAGQFYGRGCRAFTTADTDDSRPKAPAIAPGFLFGDHQLFTPVFTPARFSLQTGREIFNK